MPKYLRIPGRKVAVARYNDEHSTSIFHRTIMETVNRPKCVPRSRWLARRTSESPCTRPDRYDIVERFFSFFFSLFFFIDSFSMATSSRCHGARNVDGNRRRLLTLWASSTSGRGNPRGQRPSCYGRNSFSLGWTLSIERTRWKDVIVILLHDTHRTIRERSFRIDSFLWTYTYVTRVEETSYSPHGKE